MSSPSTGTPMEPAAHIDRGDTAEERLGPVVSSPASTVTATVGLTDLPYELLRIIWGCLNYRTRKALARTSRQLAQLTREAGTAVDQWWEPPSLRSKLQLHIILQQIKWKIMKSKNLARGRPEVLDRDTAQGLAVFAPARTFSIRMTVGSSTVQQALDQAEPFSFQDTLDSIVRLEEKYSED
ncbi:hypothetical protein CF327_g6189 [Tilletia walkeri]|nr:hypothetical protein CF327_g6189 [Tilletia walkeri]